MSQIKRVVVAHNIESTIWRRYLENESNLLKKQFIKIQADRVESFERDIYQSMDGAIAVSPQERNEIEKQSNGRPAALVDNGVDMSYFSPAGTEIEPASLVFVGSMDWRPNQDAAFMHTRDDRLVYNHTLLEQGSPDFAVYLRFMWVGFPGLSILNKFDANQQPLALDIADMGVFSNSQF